MSHPRFEKQFTLFRNRLSKLRIPGKIIFIVMGILATGWFLLRVIPKPSRAGYPCMRTAFPIMSTFILWLISFTGAFAAFKSVSKLFRKSGYLAATATLVAGLTFTMIFLNTGSLKSRAGEAGLLAEVYHPANMPMGEGQGIFPGRVVWTWDPDATNIDCPNTYASPYVSDANTDQAVVDEMVAATLMQLSGEATESEAWDAIFRHFNVKKEKGDVGYVSGETIFIKVNEGTSSWRANSDLTRKTNQSPMTETSPQVTLAILRQLVNEVGVPQANIWVADPRSHLWQESYLKFAAEFPDVNYGDKFGTYSDTRTLLHANENASLTFSDKGAAMPDAITDKYFVEMTDADYLINLAAMKAHARAGITLTAKNHFGSHTRDGAGHMHPGLVAPENDAVEREEYGLYRVQVDLMGSSVLGQNTLLFLVDGLWSGTEATEYPVKWTMAPFNNDWPNSIFASLDQVALESVCFDFLRHEAAVGSDLWKDRPNFAQGVDDYLHQAADDNNWPAGITYDPDNSGTPLGSLGTHEHWNNPTLKQYTRNKGGETGIELVAIPAELVTNDVFEAKEAAVLPVVDGIGDDDCWKTVDWNHIDQLWIPWGENNIPADDFSGKFKVMWSSATNLMYFMVTTTDDVFVDGYVYPNTGYPDYDIVEVFIDEDKSGGLHIFDTSTSDGENAFSYHIAIDQPADGGTTSSAHVLDIAGTSWSNRTTPDYFSHFPDFTVKRSGNTLTWEFSMEVHSVAYDPADPDASLVTLNEGKVMGLSMAYCDNDTPGTTRDNFFGSVEVTEAAYNDHWQLADDYGVLSLTAAGTPVNHNPSLKSALADYQFSAKGVETTIIADLNTHFEDEDGDLLSFTAVSSAAGVSVRIDGNALKGTVQPGFNSTALITVVASDPQLFNTTASFDATTVNSAPSVSTSIPDYLVEEVGVTETVVSNLTTVFEDDDSDPLTFTAASSDAQLTVTIAGNALRITSSTDFVGPANVTVTASDGAAQEQDIFVVTSTVGIALEEMENSLNLYPNPVTTEVLNVEFSSEFSGDVMIRIVGMNGQLHRALYYTKESTRFHQSIPVSDLASGIYMLEIHHQKGVLNRGFVR